MSSTSKKVCIIGAGEAGLCAAKRCLLAGHTIVIYENGSAIGGAWLRCERKGSRSFESYDKLVFVFIPFFKILLKILIIF